MEAINKREVAAAVWWAKWTDEADLQTTSPEPARWDQRTAGRPAGATVWHLAAQQLNIKHHKKEELLQVLYHKALSAFRALCSFFFASRLLFVPPSTRAVRRPSIL